MANIGSTDKKLRIIGGVVLLLVSLMALGGLGTTLGIIAIVAGIVLIVTGLVNFCPAYRLLGIRTIKTSNPEI